MDVDSVSATGPQIPQAQPSVSDPVAPPDTLPTSVLSASATAKPGAPTSQSAASALAAGQAETPASMAATKAAMEALKITKEEKIRDVVSQWRGESLPEKNHIAEAKNEAAAITKKLQDALNAKNTKKIESLSKTAIETAVKISKTKPRVAKEILFILQASEECRPQIAAEIFDKMQESESFKEVVKVFLQEFIPSHVQTTREPELFRQTQDVASRLMTLIQNRSLLTNALKSELNKFGNETFTTQVGGEYVSVKAKKIMDEITKCVNLLTTSMENIESPLKEMYKTLYESVARKFGAEEASKHLASFIFLKTIVPTIRGVGLDVGIGKKDFTTALMIYIADTSKEQTKPLWTTPNKDNPMETLQMCFKLESRIAVTAFVKQVLKACGITQKPSGPIASSSSRP